jgi:pyridinium-3,5-bisthiocarboxylic acid mononucleotide nickel chelatase
MESPRIAIIDPAAGISGDMLLGALIGAGASRDWLRGLPARLGFPDVRIAIEQQDRCGLSATKVTVTLPGGEVESPAELVHSHHHETSHEHHHGAHHPDQHHGGHHHHHGPHRHVGELIGLVERAAVSPWIRERAVRAFQLLGEAEGKIHGLPAHQVPLHEVGAVDALVDIVGAIEGFEQLGIQEIYHRPLALGTGWIRAAHGVIPVPAPATAILLEGLEVGPNGPVVGEATTPTGAVLLRVLSRGAAPARWRMVASAWGAGGRNPAGYPNALRLILAEPAGEAAETVMLATDIDDLNPEYLEPLREALMVAGALDVQIWATQMKKGRTGFRLEIVASESTASVVTETLFRHSTTAGVRRWRAERVTLPRRELTVTVGGFKVRVKVLDSPDGPRVKPEYDDIAALAKQLGRPIQDVALEVREQAVATLGTAAGQGSSLNKEQ